MPLQRQNSVRAERDTLERKIYDNAAESSTSEAHSLDLTACRDPPIYQVSQTHCPSCLDLQYDLFRKLEHGNYWTRLAPCTTLRFHISSPKLITTSALQGCKYCSIICQGINRYWYDTEKSRRVEDETNEGIEMIGKEKEIDNKEGSKQNNLFLELIPGKPLSVFRSRNDTTSPYGEIHTRLEFFTNHGQIPIHPAFSCSPEVPTHLDLPRCIKILQDWLQECITRHSACLGPLSKLPKRLIYVLGDAPRLVDTKNFAYSHYTTLSHCWGKDADSIKTTLENVDRVYAGIDWDELPQIFKDAIAVTRSIGCQWIWIDSLCIIQGDDVDWKEQSAKMAEIYSNSYLNIAATLSPDNFGSLFSSRKILGDDRENWRWWSLDDIALGEPPGCAGLRVRVSHGRGHEYLVANVRSGRQYAAPLLERAWVLQERLLAPRTLHFGCSELIWECNSSLACECTGISAYNLTRDVPNATDSPTNISAMLDAGGSTGTLKGVFANIRQDKLSQEEMLDFWLKVVAIYSSLSLKRIFDRPYALTGIASRISSRINCNYLAGMWAADVPRSLLWASVPRSSPSRRRLPSIAPTWSWMSQYDPEYSTSRVLFGGNGRRFNQDDRLRIHYSDTFCDWSDLNPFGSIPFGQIEITAAVLQGKLRHSEEAGITVQLPVASYSVWADCPTEDRLRDGQEVLCLLPGIFELSVAEINLLVLKMRSESTDYTRVGIAASILTEHNILDYVEIRRVRIL